jgi:hypothetical protein
MFSGLSIRLKKEMEIPYAKKIPKKTHEEVRTAMQQSISIE